MGCGLIFMGLSNSSSTGSKGLGTSGLAQKSKAKKLKAIPNRSLPLTFDEVQEIRKVYETTSLTRKQVYDQFVGEKMTFAGMCNILNYTTRVHS